MPNSYLQLLGATLGLLPVNLLLKFNQILLGNNGHSKNEMLLWQLATFSNLEMFKQ